jgi:hypothetical protein
MRPRRLAEVVHNPGAKPMDEGALRDHPVPTGELARYCVDRDPHTELDIRRYVETEAHPEIVQHAERIKKEVVLGHVYDVWDVITEEDRYWVVTNLTNLYSQKQFPSLDYVLSFHVGLMTRLQSRSAAIDPSEPTPFDEVLRRADQAAVLNDKAVEAEDFQAVGMLLRESLLSLVEALRGRVEVEFQDEVPKGADFVRWSELLTNALCPGGATRELRQHLKTAAREAWQLSSWLTHARNASRTASSVAMHSCQTTIGHFIQVLEGGRSDKIGKCPVCRSSDVRTHFDRNIRPDGDYYASCGICGWTDHPQEPEADL